MINAAVVGGVMFAISHYFHANNWLKFIGVCLITDVFGYGLSFLILFNKEEKKKVIRYSKQKISRLKNRVTG